LLLQAFEKPPAEGAWALPQDRRDLDDDLLLAVHGFQSPFSGLSAPRFNYCPARDGPRYPFATFNP
jgi:hypothetical protein